MEAVIVYIKLCALTKAMAVDFLFFFFFIFYLIMIFLFYVFGIFIIVTYDCEDEMVWGVSRFIYKFHIIHIISQIQFPYNFKDVLQWEFWSVQQRTASKPHWEILRKQKKTTKFWSTISRFFLCLLILYPAIWLFLIQFLNNFSLLVIF